MTFLAPWMFLFLAFVPPLILLYFLKLKRPRVEISSTLLWRRVIEDLRVNSPFQRLRRSLLLLLQLLLLLLLVFALVRPTRLTRESASDTLIVLVDVSASMQAREADGHTRLDLAKEALGKLVAKLDPNDQMMILTFSDEARVACGFTASRRQLRDTIAAIAPTDRPTDIREALELARSLARTAAKPRLAIVSDGAFTNPGDLDISLPIEYQQVGTGDLDNVAITSLDVRRALRDRRFIEMFVSLQSFAPRTLKGSMLVYLDDQLLDTKAFTLDGGQKRSQIFEAELPTGGAVRVELEVDDALAADNRAYQIALPPQRLSVLIVGQHNFFIERVYRAAGTVQVDSVAPDAYDPVTAANYTAVVWNGVDAPGVASTSNIYLGCVPQLDGLIVGEAVSAPAVVNWDTSHPANRFIDFSNLLIQEATQVTFPDDVVPLVSGPEAPLIGLTQVGQHSACVVAFDPFKSNWPLLVSFPIFLHNCLSYFDERFALTENTNLRVGRAIACPATYGEPTLTLPSGETAPMIRQGTGDYLFAEVDRCGIYRLAAGDEYRRTIAANLFDPVESTLTAGALPELGGQLVAAVDLAHQVNEEFSRPLLVAALALLLLEWIAFHRRWFY